MINSKIISMIFAFMVMSVTVQAMAVSPPDCGEIFQSQLSELLATKKTCDSAGFYDCCQVHELVKSIATTLYNLVYFIAD